MSALVATGSWQPACIGGCRQIQPNSHDCLASKLFDPQQRSYDCTAVSPPLRACEEAPGCSAAHREVSACFDGRHSLAVSSFIIVSIAFGQWGSALKHLEARRGWMTTNLKFAQHDRSTHQCRAGEYKSYLSPNFAKEYALIWTEGGRNYKGEL